MTERDAQGVPFSPGGGGELPLPPQTNDEHDVYAWVRLARFLDVRKEAYEKAVGDVLYVDLCSSFPLYAEMLRSRHAAHLHQVARREARGLHGAFQQPNHVLPYLADELEPASRKHLSSRLFKRPVNQEGQTVDDHLTSVIYRALNEYEISWSTSGKGERQEALASNIVRLLHEDRTVTIAIPPTKDKSDFEARWQIKQKTHTAERTFAETLTNFIIPTQTGVDGEGKRRASIDIAFVREEVAEGIMRDIANHVSSNIVDFARPYRAVSVDIANPQTLLDKAEAGFDAEITGTTMYERAKELKDHVEQDLFEFVSAQPDNSVTLYTCFEGFPIYFGLEDDDAAKYQEQLKYMKNIGSEIFRSLKPGGAALFFPWQILPATPSNQAMAQEVLLHFKRIGADIDYKPYHREEVLHWMTDRERDLAMRTSPILQSGEETIWMLKVNKPKSAAYAAWVTRVALYQ